MRLWIKYDSVSFKAAETCQDCHLFSDSIAVKWQFKSGGLSLSWQVFNLCSISAHRRALFCIHCFVDRLSSPGLCCFLTLSPSLSPSPSLTSWLFLFPTLLQFHLVLYSNSSAGLDAHKQLTHPTITSPPTSDHLPHTNHPALKALTIPSPFSYSSPAILSFFLPLLLPLLPYRPGDHSFVPDICFVGWLIEMSMWGEGLWRGSSDPPGNVHVNVCVSADMWG